MPGAHAGVAVRWRVLRRAATGLDNKIGHPLDQLGKLRRILGKQMADGALAQQRVMLRHQLAQAMFAQRFDHPQGWKRHFRQNQLRCSGTRLPDAGPPAAGRRSDVRRPGSAGKRADTWRGSLCE